MATSYTSLLGFALPVAGELNGTWGTTVNDSITQLAEDSIAGVATASVLSADWTLTTTGSGASNQARKAILIPTGAPGVSRNIIAPAKSKIYTVINQSNANVVIKAAATTGVTIAAGDKVTVVWNGSDFVSLITTNGPGSFTNLAYTGTLTGGTGIVNIGSNQIYKDASGNVGIGKVPSVLLDVNGSVNTGNMQTGNGVSTGAAFIELGGLRSGAGISYVDFHSIAGGDFEARIARQPNANGSFDLVNTGTGNINIFQTAAAPIVFSVSSVEKARFDSSGYLLVGTTSASGTNLLQVNSDALINGLTVGKGLGSMVTNTAFGVTALNTNTTGTNNTAFGYQALRLNDTGAQNIAFGGGALANNTSGNYNTAIGLNVLVANTIGGGNSGLGLQALSSNTTGSSNNAYGFYSLNQNTIGASNNGYGRFSLQSATSSVATLGTITGGSGYTNGTYTGVVMTLSSGSTAFTYPTATIVVSGGAVTTVTITSPGSAFKDTTTVLTAPAASIGGTGSGFSVPVATLSTANNNTAVGDQALRFLVNGSLNTAVGVAAGTGLTGASINTFIGYNAGASVTTGSNNVVIGSYTGAAAPISGTGSNYIVLSDGTGNVRQVIDSSGNVGIGTNSPSTYGKFAILGVSGNVVSNVVNTSSTSGDLSQQIITANTYTLTTSVNANGNITSYSNGAFYASGTTSAAPQLFITNNSERMRIDSSGNVGIGTSTPSAKLHVSSGRSYFVANSEPYSIGMKYGTTAGLDYFYIGATNSATPSCVFSNAGGIELMRIDNSGNVGIGATNSGTYGQFGVMGTSYRSLFVQSTDASGAIGIIAANSSSEVRIGAASNHPLAIYTNATERMRIFASGGVSIGNTTDPGATNLSVTGIVTAAGFSGNATTATTATNLASGSAGTIPYQSAAGVTAMLAAGTAGNVLISNGTAAPSWSATTGTGSIVKADSPTFTGTVSAATVNGTTMQYGGVAMPRMVLATAVATTSGTSIDFTGLPSWVKKITVMLNGVSTAGAGTNLLIQIGAGSVATTGYVATAGTFAAGPATGVTPTTIGFNINVTTVGEITSGTMTLCLSGSNIWISSHSVKTGTAALGIGGGNITLGGALDRVRLTTLNGTDTFDAGSVNILYEG
jgi:hypothetical protein